MVIPLILIAGITMGFTLRNFYQFGSESIQQRGLSQLDLYASNLDTQFQALARIAEDTANFLSIAEHLSEDEIFALLNRNAQQSPLIYGSAIAFEPYAFADNKRLFSPYVYGTDNDLSIMNIGADAYDYTDGSNEWFSAIRETLKPRWTEPYFDEGAGDVLMVTYSAPFFTDGEFKGVATIDVSLANLHIESAKELDQQLFSIQSSSGQFISHYNSNLVMNASIQEQSALIDHPQYSDSISAMAQGQRGADRLKNFFLDGEIIDGNTWVFYTPIASTGWSLTTIVPEIELTSELSALLNRASYSLLLMVITIFLLAWLISSRITRPISTLAKAVASVARGKLDTPIENIGSMDEIGKLSTDFNVMVKNLKKQIAMQSEQQAASQLVERELQMARETQKSLLPSEFPPFPDRLEFELHAVNKPARHVAGDFFDYFLVNPKTLVFVIADVSGKGMSAALVMAVSRTIIRNLARSGKTPAQILTETNDRLIDNHKGSAFVTVFLGSYNISNGKMIYANGGHSAALKVDPLGQISSFGDATGTIVGMLENQQYLNAHTRILPGEMFLLYTDGLSEARAPSGEFYGEQRIETLMEKNISSSPSVLCESAITEICAFQEHNLADDITLLALKRSPTKISQLITGLIKKKPN